MLYFSAIFWPFRNIDVIKSSLDSLNPQRLLAPTSPIFLQFLEIETNWKASRGVGYFLFLTLKKVILVVKCYWGKWRGRSVINSSLIKLWILIFLSISLFWITWNITHKYTGKYNSKQKKSTKYQQLNK